MVGLLSRWRPALQPAVVAAYAGDTLWAAMVFWMLATILRHAATLTIASAALATSVVVEASQAYHAPWIDRVRSGGIGALVFGQGFRWSDVACYALGVGLAAWLDVWLARSRERAASYERT